MAALISAAFTGADNTLLTSYTPDIGTGPMVQSSVFTTVPKIVSNQAVGTGSLGITYFPDQITVTTYDVVWTHRGTSTQDSGVVVGGKVSASTGAGGLWYAQYVQALGVYCLMVAGNNLQPGSGPIFYPITIQTGDIITLRVHAISGSLGVSFTFLVNGTPITTGTSSTNFTALQQLTGLATTSATKLDDYSVTEYLGLLGGVIGAATSVTATGFSVASTEVAQNVVGSASYTWYIATQEKVFGQFSAFVLISGATSSTLTATGLTADTNYRVYRLATDSSGGATAASNTITVYTIWDDTKPGVAINGDSLTQGTLTYFAYAGITGYASDTAPGVIWGGASAAWITRLLPAVWQTRQRGTGGAIWSQILGSQNTALQPLFTAVPNVALIPRMYILWAGENDAGQDPTATALTRGTAYEASSIKPGLTTIHNQGGTARVGFIIIANLQPDNRSATSTTVWTLNTTGSPTGTFVLNVNGTNTAALNVTATAATMASACNAIAPTCTGSGGTLPTQIKLTFSGLKANGCPITIDTSGVSGGTVDLGSFIDRQSFKTNFNAGIVDALITAPYSTYNAVLGDYANLLGSDSASIYDPSYRRQVDWTHHTALAYFEIAWYNYGLMRTAAAASNFPLPALNRASFAYNAAGLTPPVMADTVVATGISIPVAGRHGMRLDSVWQYGFSFTGRMCNITYRASAADSFDSNRFLYSVDGGDFLPFPPTGSDATASQNLGFDTWNIFTDRGGTDTTHNVTLKHNNAQALWLDRDNMITVVSAGTPSVGAPTSSGGGIVIGIGNSLLGIDIGIGI